MKLLLRSQPRILSYLTFPLLEAIARSICNAFINPDGTVINTFTIDGRRYNAGQRCNSLKHALMQSESLSSQVFQGWHSRLENVVQRITPTAPLYTAIYGWRNEVLHGGDFVASKNRIILNLAILFLLEKCRNDYAELASKAKKKISKIIRAT